jgi:hypothetical protein
MSNVTGTWYVLSSSELKKHEHFHYGKLRRARNPTTLFVPLRVLPAPRCQLYELRRDYLMLHGKKQK